MTTTTDQFLDANGMNYTVSRMPAPHPIERDKDIPRQFHLVRSTDGAVVSPKTVSKRYTPTNPRDMIVPVEAWIAEGFVTPEKGYVLSDGSHEMLSFRIDGGTLPEKGQIVGEDWYWFFNLHNFHGGGSLLADLFSYRLRCKNGAVSLMPQGSIRLRHMGNLQTKYEDAMKTWQKLKDEIRKIADRLTIWNASQVTAQQALGIFHEIYEIEDPNNIPTRTANEFQFAVQQFSNPALGTNGRSVYDIFNAVTATNTHYRPTSSRETDTKKLSSLFNPSGSRHKLEARTISLLNDAIGR